VKGELYSSFDTQDSKIEDYIFATLNPTGWKVVRETEELSEWNFFLFEMVQKIT
jgi:hypothetical protein